MSPGQIHDFAVYDRVEFWDLAERFIGAEHRVTDLSRIASAADRSKAPPQKPVVVRPNGTRMIPKRIEVGLGT